MTKKDIAELRRRLKKSDCSITKMCGCYVNSNNEIQLHINETFLNLDDDEFDKYLAIAKKTLSGTLGNNLLELEFPMEEEEIGGKQDSLMELKRSKLKDEDLLDSFYQLIIDNYDYAGNYLILVFHDVYDVIKKTTDNFSLDESEEVYEYLICAICPVELTKAGLGYLEDENKIGPRHRDWVVSLPDTGFIFPAFTDRSTDIHSAMFYTKKPLEAHKEIIELVLGCPSKQTAAEQKNTFQTIIKKSVNDSDQEEKVFADIQESLSMLAEEQAELLDSSEEPVILRNDSIHDILAQNSLSKEITDKIESAYEENFGEEPPAIDYLLDKKVLAENNKRKVEMALMEKVELLQEQLDEARNVVVENSDESNYNTDYDEGNKELEYDVILRVKPNKVDHIKSEFIDGKKCIVIPIDEDEEVNINGMTDLI